MADFTVKSDSVDVEQIMRQVRSRIREKRGVDYTEDEIRELASVKLERFLDPKGVRSDLLEQYRKRRDASTSARNYSFEDTTIYESSRSLLRGLRKLLNPILKLFFNPTPVVEALHIQSKLNDTYNQAESLYYELIHNLVLETTRLSIEVKNLKMRIESLTGRLEFNERRARALESVVVYQPSHEDVRASSPPGRQQPAVQAPASSSPPAANAGPIAAPPEMNTPAEGPGQRSRRRRRRRGRRGGGPAAAIMGSPATDQAVSSGAAPSEQADGFAEPADSSGEEIAHESDNAPSLEEGSDDEP